MSGRKATGLAAGRKKIFAAVFLLSFSFCLSIGIAFVNNKTKMERAQMEQLVLLKANTISEVISRLLYKTQVLSALVVQGGGVVQNFESVAATVIDDPAIKNILLAPDGVVTEVYPRAENQGVIGLNFMTPGKGNIEAVKAKELGKLVMGGPFDLVQGGQALVGRLPVYTKDKAENKVFWGLVSVTLNYPQALNGAGLEQLRTSGLAFEIWRINPDDGKRQIIAHSDYEYDKNAQYIESPLNILNARWYFRLSPIRRIYQYPETWLFLAFGVLISLLIASLVVHNLDLMKIKDELEDISARDLLTGMLNRRGLFNILTQMLKEKEKFAFCYIDLDKFKKINDTYGHLVGDTVLEHFAAVLEKYLGKDNISARIGGDEFILVFKNTSSVKTVRNFVEAVRTELKKPLVLSSGEKIFIRFSFGAALYPENGQTVDELTSYADRAMYENKAPKR